MGFLNWVKKVKKPFLDEDDVLGIFRDLAVQMPVGCSCPIPTGCDLDGKPGNFVSFIVHCSDIQIAKVKECPSIEVMDGIVTSIHEPTFNIIFIMFRFDKLDDLTYSVPMTLDSKEMNKDLLALSEQHGMQFILVSESTHKVLRVEHNNFHKLLKLKLSWLENGPSVPCPMSRFPEVVMILNNETQSASGTWRLFEEYEGLFKINL